MLIEIGHTAGLPLGMRVRVVSVLFLLICSLLIPVSINAAVKQGETCKKVGTSSTAKGLKYTCVKSGKKLVWSKGIPIRKNTPTPVATPTPPVEVSPTPVPSATPLPTLTPTPSPTPTPIVLPTSFADLFENRKGIGLAAWQKSSEIIKNNKSKVGTLEIFTGPNTKPSFDDYPTPVALVSRLFPNRSEPEKTIVIRYKYVDIAWAESILRSKLTPEEFTRLNNIEGGRAITGRCNDSEKNCRGAMQQTTMSRISLIIQGVPNSEDRNDPTGGPRFSGGMVEAHEYFHALQRIPIMDKAFVWPHAWFREGSAEWVQNVAINFEDLKAYQNFLIADCSNECSRLSEAEIAEFLETSKENYTAPKFSPFLNYNLGARIIEALVALNGPDTLIDMYEQMGKRLTFEQAFKNTYGVEWSYAIPILAKAIHANLKDGL